mmetsp:Transcript_25072/g.69159  ORF Transcript_25072/g.69159 Transcript_25072/m.69159 type:complete len:490 (+) Transcript_25072:91-1560(+)|eukprot:CAMPEP_0172365268 /NCGR_PEP_ID=MMETSP1060-20121228/8199_1 /TAXON_ID=37318 /ORGANISM="Pseudo-nitzschia pungens, Strain cf. cingulata" /LENGTH=489 /DNA_ID=CAMNT_0013088483 /DNA_START=13 /DNA_END=1482 /DNA_ORIENTATION=-
MRTPFSSGDYNSSSASMGYSTYEFTRAQEFSASNPDQIHYDKDVAFRNEDYRHVFHQEGTIGTFSVRLLEAAGLNRRYWSALALGPMRHLGLSKAHGKVSSFVSFRLDTTAATKSMRRDSIDDYDKKMSAKSSAEDSLNQFSTYVSSVVPNNNNPVWTNCEFEIPLKKGALEDGQPVRIGLRVDEEATAIENIIPGIPSAGGVARLLGVGCLDVTSLCLGQNPVTGRPATGVIDAWVPIQLPDEKGQGNSASWQTMNEEFSLQKKVEYDAMDKKKASVPNKEEGLESRPGGMGGRVRVLITYHPHGMTPQRNDIVALEAFARQDLRTATCNSILPPLIPMQVAKVSEPWLLLKYRPYETIDDFEMGANRNNDRRKAFIRIHRNAVFVIERKKLIDSALNLALQPAEFVLSTPLGQGAQEVLGPTFVASKQLLMPVLLSSKLMWMAVRTTALAGFTGMSAAGAAFVNEGTNSLTRDGRRRPDDNRKVRYV